MDGVDGSPERGGSCRVGGVGEAILQGGWGCITRWVGLICAALNSGWGCTAGLCNSVGV